MDVQRKRKLDDEPEPAPTTITVITPAPILTPPQPPQPATKPPPSSSDEAINPELLRMYYDRFFPCALFMRWKFNKETARAAPRPTIKYLVDG